MARRKWIVAALGGVTWLVLPPPSAWAQLGNSEIAGVVRDTGGGVLPGVTVEAASQALIEKVRTVTTDEQGQYKIVDLRPGTYGVTFTLTGFTTFKREGIELTANFTASVNADMKVGGVEETITVSGASPVVDVQTTATRNVLSEAVLDAVPTNRTLTAWAALTPGLSAGATAMDLGGSKGEQPARMAIHGGRSVEQRILLDGLNTNGGGSSLAFWVNTAATQEVSIELGGGSAELSTGAVQINFIPKDGGNTYTAFLFANYANDAMQGNNFSDDLRGRGLTEGSGNAVDHMYDVNSTVGGPILRDKLWFFTAHRKWGSATTIAGLFANATQDSWFYTPDLSVPALEDYRQRSHSARLTWQATSKHRLRAHFEYQHSCQCHAGTRSGDFFLLGTTATEAALLRAYKDPNTWTQVAWNFVPNSRLLFEAGSSLRLFKFWDGFTLPRHEGGGRATADTISVTELATNLRYRANPLYGYTLASGSDQRASMSYVTGSHAFKVGLAVHQEWSQARTQPPSAVTYTFRNREPVLITQYANPLSDDNRMVELGVFGQDRWTIKRLTLNLGLRLEYLRGWVPEQSIPAGPFVPARHFDPVSCVPCLWDLSPRASAAYDLFGNGHTALKVSVGRYSAVGTTELTRTVNPARAVVTQANRAWTDANHDFIPQPSELGPLSNSAFGTSVVNTRVSDEVLKGIGNREHNWQFATNVQQQLWPGIALDVGYYRTAWGNQRATDNVLVTPADYDPFCITLPRDQRLPGGGGNQLCGLYDVTPTKFNRVETVVGPAQTFGERKDIFNGIDVTVNARLPRGAFVGGGMSMGSQETDTCLTVDSPQALLYCRVKSPFFRPEIKLRGSYPLPADMQLGVVFQSLPGIPVSASYVATLAEVQPTLGRPLAGNLTTVTIANIFQPQTMFEDRINQVDLRFTKSFRIGRARVQGIFDLYNVLNASPVLSVNTRYGAAWLTPTENLGARLVKFGAQVDF